MRCLILRNHHTILLAHCQTELGAVSKLNAAGEFSKRNVKVNMLPAREEGIYLPIFQYIYIYCCWLLMMCIVCSLQILGLSCDSPENHKGWAEDIKAATGAGLNYPLIADTDRSIAKKLGMLHNLTDFQTGLPLPVRSLFIIGPDKTLKLQITYPASTGRNWTEVMRVIDSLQMTSNKKLATPSDWVPGENAVILPSVSNVSQGTDRHMMKIFNDLPPFLYGLLSCVIIIIHCLYAPPFYCPYYYPNIFFVTS